MFHFPEMSTIYASYKKIFKAQPILFSFLYCLYLYPSLNESVVDSWQHLETLFKKNDKA